MGNFEIKYTAVVKVGVCRLINSLTLFNYIFNSTEINRLSEVKHSNTLQ